MFKTISSVALVQLSSAALSGDFFSGLETGVHVTDLDQFAEYSCPEPEITSHVESMLGMFHMAKGMMKPKSSQRTLKQTADHYEKEGDSLVEKLDKYAN